MKSIKKKLEKSKLFNRIASYVATHQDWLIICTIITVKVGLMVANIGHFPYYENDEATYTLRASTFVQNGQLDYYTYWYDHAPAGWITLSPFILLNRILSNPISDLLLLRLVMILLATASAVLTYLIAVKLFKKRLPALIAVTFLLVSPLLMYYQRRVLLDNVMIFWLLLSIYFIVAKPHKLRAYAFSGIVFGIAVLSKINAAFMVPAMWLLIWQQQKHKVIRRHALVLWTFLMTSVTSLWLLYAALKGELWPASPHPETGEFVRISLLDTLKFQSARGGQTRWPWDPQSNIYPNAVDWFSRDTAFAALFLAFFVTTMALLWRKKIRQEIGFVVLSIAMLTLFMVRGGVVLGFYVLPLAPFAALIVGWAIYKVLSHFKHVDFRRAVATLTIVAIAGANIPAIASQWYQDETSNQIAAVNWIKQNIPDKNALIISDNYALPYLVNAGYKNVDYQYKVEYDPAINGTKYNKDWRSGDYILLSHEVLKQIKEGVTPFVKEAFDHSVLVADFRKGSSSYIDTKQYISTNGDWAQIYKIKTDEGVVLQDSWQTYKQTYLRSYGQVLDPATNTTSAYDQAITMQMAIEENDLQTFNGVWQWTKDHFQNRLNDKLLSSAWGTVDGKEQLVDANASTNASLQAALALVEAHNKWHGERLKNEAQKMLNDLQKVGFRQLGDLQVQIGFATDIASAYLVNPSYADPYAYSMFAQFTASPEQKQFWQVAYADYFKFLERLQARSAVGLVPNWVRVSTAGAISSAVDVVGATGDTYGYESYVIPFLLARDLQKNNVSQAATYLKKFEQFYLPLLKESGKSGIVNAGYNLNGTPALAFEDIATNTAAIASLGSSVKQRKQDLATEKIFGQYDTTKKQWGKVPEALNLRNQQAAWRYVSLYYERL